MKLHFNRRKWWYFGKHQNKSIHIEISGWSSSPSIYFRSDGSEREHSFHIGLGIGIWICFERCLSEKWYPKNYDEKEFSLQIHGGSFWWNFWISEEWSSYSKNKTWRKGCFHFVDKIKGKHKYEKKSEHVDQFLLPFVEGIYNVEITKYARTDSYSHWPTKKMTTFEVKAGYYDEKGNWKDKPVPVEGKGENSWDCDEDATYAMSFPGEPYKKDLKSTYDAALYFWHSMMKSRERRASPKWIPKEFKDQKLKILR